MREISHYSINIALTMPVVAIAQKLGRTEEIECKTSDEFTERIDKYISSADDGGAGTPNAALWPLIREVHVRCHAPALSSGAVLVDLPGIADANAARNTIAQDYLKHAHRIWIVAPITRAVDDGTAQSMSSQLRSIVVVLTSPSTAELLGDVFKAQLLSEYSCSIQILCFFRDSELMHFHHCQWMASE